MPYFLSYRNAKDAVDHVIKLLAAEKYRTDYLNGEVLKSRKGFFIDVSCETDPQITVRFRHLLREYVRTMRKYISV